MNWRRRFPQWLEALALENRNAGRLPWLTMLRAILSGVIPRAVWRQRMRTCMTCPLYSTEQSAVGKLHLCKSAHPSFLGLGCHCAVNVAALTANPHGDGCFGRTLPLTLGLGWPAHAWPSRWARIRSPVDFLLRR